ncbi:flagellar export protein FliJ [Clostridium tertium]|jgi:flagellar protein FliJ|uniref:Flagellar FliJ protein n=2 Tax=Clostridium tertium TaxID=1559 RepID=A0A9X4B0J7_9CLOT|nr:MULTISPECIES: flagellar export protein FliJ [Clostridium]MBP1866775.1 flagellar FliJ protein [Clostridium tertium]MBS6502214.1 flagellar export protein FliJ [Clostridium sp.]MBU6135910.1 flagellar export protein FliJ [Clostridium tertium]MDB1939658.1 flagellar export protein FliJ [Clostridium tertium]MDB1948391.1 flagellar export protein FliJ [Clostridium tertium]
MSGNFKFRLEKLLEIRTEKEEESKRLFNKTEIEKQKTEEKLNNLKFNYEKYNGINKGESIVYQKIKRNYLFALDKGITETEKDLTIKLKELDIRREDLLKKQIERKTVDILKERKSLEFYKEEERKDQIFNDELALYAYMRKH